MKRSVIDPLTAKWGRPLPNFHLGFCTCNEMTLACNTNLFPTASQHRHTAHQVSFDTIGRTSTQQSLSPNGDNSCTGTTNPSVLASGSPLGNFPLPVRTAHTQLNPNPQWSVMSAISGPAGPRLSGGMPCSLPDQKRDNSGRHHSAQDCV